MHTSGPSETWLGAGLGGRVGGVTVRWDDLSVARLPTKGVQVRGIAKCSSFTHSFYRTAFGEWGDIFS